MAPPLAMLSLRRGGAPDLEGWGRDTKASWREKALAILPEGVKAAPKPWLGK